MGAFITPTRALFCIGSPERSPFFVHGKDFLGFFSEPFPGAIITAALTTAIIITAVTVTAISSTLIRIKVFPFGETF